MATFEVSCDMKFASRSDRDAVHAYLLDRYIAGGNSGGDSIAMETTADGAYRVTCSMRLSVESDRDDIHAYLHGMRALAQSGRIGRHLCRHDEGLPCIGNEVDSWG